MSDVNWADLYDALMQTAVNKYFSCSGATRSTSFFFQFNMMSFSIKRIITLSSWNKWMTDVWYYAHNIKPFRLHLMGYVSGRIIKKIF